MTVIIDGTNGVSDVDGSAATPALRGTDANTGIFFPAADTIAFAEGGTEVARIDSLGNTGFGTTTPGARVDGTAPINALRGQVTEGSMIFRQVNSSISSGITELHLRADAGKSTYLTYTENAIDDRWSVGIQNGNGGLRFLSGTPASGTLRMNLTSAGLLQFNSGFGSVATAYACRAWVNYDGTGTPSIRGSGNVSSISDNGTGQFWVNFSSGMPDTNYACTGNTESNAVFGGENIVTFPNTTGRCNVETFIGTTATDNFITQVVVFR